MTLITQDDRLSAGAWAARGPPQMPEGGKSRKVRRGITCRFNLAKLGSLTTMWWRTSHEKIVN